MSDDATLGIGESNVYNSAWHIVGLCKHLEWIWEVDLSVCIGIQWLSSCPAFLRYGGK